MNTDPPLLEPPLSDSISKINFFTYLNNNYDKLRKECTIAISLKGMKFSDDIFHDTIIRMHTILNERDRVFRRPDEFQAYFFSSLYTNTVRDKLYYRNSRKVYIEDTFGFDVCVEEQDSCDYDILLEDVCYTFGDVGKAFVEHVNGYTLAELKKEFPRIKNLYGKIRAVADYVRNKYSGELLEA